MKAKIKHIDEQPVLKTCIRCKKSYPATAEYFRRYAPYPDGLTIYCKPCHNELGKISNAKYNMKKRKARLIARLIAITAIEEAEAKAKAE